MENVGNSSYNGLDAKVEKRLSHGLSFLSAFTWSKSMNDFPEICCSSPTPQNSWDTSNERGRSDFDQKLRWVTSFDYVLPLGSGHAVLEPNKLEDEVFGGWHLGGIYTMHTGFYMSPVDRIRSFEYGFLRRNPFRSGLQRQSAVRKTQYQ